MNIDLLKKKIQEANPTLTRKYTTRNGHGEKVEDTVVSTREIRLADVLVAIQRKDLRRYCCDELGNILWYSREGKILGGEVSWNLLDDNLDNQTDKCKQFLIDLLV